MKKQDKTNMYIGTAGLFLFLALLCAAAALCLWRYLPQEALWHYVVAAVSVTFFLVYVIVCSVASKKCENGKSFFLLAWAIVFVSVILIGLSPIAAVLWVFEAISEKIHKQEQF